MVAGLLVLLGALLAVCGVLAHDTDVGIVLTVVAPLATVYALPGGWWSRLALTVGYDVVLVLFVPSRPEGDVLIGADVRGYLLLGVGLVLLSFSIATLRPLRPPEDPPRDQAEPVADPPSQMPGPGAADS